MSENTTINDRILELMQFLELSPSAFADEIGIQRSALTHIFKGRNKASLDVVQKIINRFTDTNILWLINGMGNMSISTPTILKLQTNNTVNKQDIDNKELKNTLFDVHISESNTTSSVELQKERSPYQQKDFLVQDTIPQTIKEHIPPTPSLLSTQIGKRITKILVFFDDNTFQELT